MDDKLNGEKPPPEGEQPPQPAIVVTFDPDGRPNVQLQGGVDGTYLTTAATWLRLLGELQIKQRLAKQLQAQGPRIQPVGIG